MLIVGGIVAVALAVLAVVMQPWLAVPAVLVAVAAGVLGHIISSRAMRAARERAAAQAAKALDASVASEERHHRESMGIIVRFTARVNELRATIDDLTAQLAQARSALLERENLIAGLRSTQATLTDNAADLRARVVDLEERVALQEQELNHAMSEANQVADAARADILVLPRRPQLTGRGSSVPVETTLSDAAVAN